VQFAAVRRWVADLSWVQLSFLAGGVLLLCGSLWRVDSLRARVVRDVTLYLLGPALLGATYGRRMGWRVDRLAVRNTVLLSLFVLPFYVVGSSLPTIRAYYPMWETSSALGEFLPHTLLQFTLAVAAESYYRGLLCVGVREIGYKAVFVSPVVYALNHLAKPPVELLLSGPTDVLFGFVDYRSNSILPSIVAHGAGLTLLDWLVLHEPLLPPSRVVQWLSWLPLPL
jgi:membrane protease YdiL (CAAX protease family)